MTKPPICSSHQLFFNTPTFRVLFFYLSGKAKRVPSVHLLKDELWRNVIINWLVSLLKTTKQSIRYQKDFAPMIVNQNLNVFCDKGETESWKKPTVFSLSDSSIKPPELKKKVSLVSSATLFDPVRKIRSFFNHHYKKRHANNYSLLVFVHWASTTDITDQWVPYEHDCQGFLRMIWQRDQWSTATAP